MKKDNFKATVPNNVVDKIKSIFDVISLDDLVHSFDFMGEESLESIEGNYYDGWIPHQDGGFSLERLHCSEIDKHYFSEGHKKSCEHSYNDMIKSFKFDNDIDDIDYDDESVLESLQDYENSWNEDNICLVQFQIFCDDFSGHWERKPSVTIRLSVNYRDTPYFREKYAEDLESVTYDVEEFLSLNKEEIINTFKQA